MSNMSDSTSLPHSVQQLIHEICTNQNQPPPDAEAIQALASVDEEEALNVLSTIEGKRIHSSFSGFIMYLINQRHNNTRESPQKRRRLPPSSSHNGSPADIVRHMNPSQVLNDGVSRSPVPEPPRGSLLTSSMSSRMESNRILIPQYVALGKLEFRKAFLILSYIGKKKLEDAMSADKIHELKDLSMVNLESKLWSTFGNDMDPKERRMSIDWDSGKTHIYRCHC